MGQAVSKEEEAIVEELSKLKQSVLFTDWEMRKLYARFEEMGGSLDRSITLKPLIEMPEFEHNPFKYRIARIFSEREISEADMQTPTEQHRTLNTQANNSLTRDHILAQSQIIEGYTMSLDSFFKLMSAFSYRADLHMKTRLAFAIYDFDCDGYINYNDIECMLILALGHNAFQTQQFKQIAYEVMSEVDVDNSGTLTEIEFSRVVTRLADFTSRLTVDIHF